VERFTNSTNQRSISTKLQTALCMMTVSTVAPHSGRVGFKFQKPSGVSGESHTLHYKLSQ